MKDESLIEEIEETKDTGIVWPDYNISHGPFGICAEDVWQCIEIPKVDSIEWFVPSSTTIFFKRFSKSK